MDNLDEQAHELVNKFVEVLETKHGIKLETVKDALSYYEDMSKWSNFFAKSVVASFITAFVGGVFYLLIEGFKHITHIIHG